MSEKENERIRSIGKELLDQLKKGKFSPFVDIVRDKQNNDIDDNLALCFRGSGGKEMVSIYKYNTKMWDLFLSGDEAEPEPTVMIQLNFGRFTKDWEKKVEELEQLGFKRKDSDTDNKNKYIKSNYRICDFIYEVKNESKSKIKEVVDKSYNIMSAMMDDYYGHSKDKSLYIDNNEKRIQDYFKQYYHELDDKKEFAGRKQRRLEKHVQQEIFMKNHLFKNGLFLYDLEFHQPGIDNFENIEIYRKNEPDMFGIMYDKGVPESICLVEIKSTKGALDPKRGSGLCEHRDGMKSYMECQELMDDRRKEAVKIMSHYSELNLYGVTEDKVNLLKEKINDLNNNIIFIFTNKLNMNTKFNANDKRIKICEAMDGCKPYGNILYGDWCKYQTSDKNEQPFSYRYK